MINEFKKFAFVILFVMTGVISITGSIVADPLITKDKIRDLQEQLAELEERLDELEKDTASDKIQFTGQLTSKFHSTRYEVPEDDIDENDQFKQLLFNLNMRTAVTENFRFTGRMTMFKNWGEEIHKHSNGIVGSGEPRDSTLRLTRAYVDYFFSDGMSFTLGRLPASDGPPVEILEDTPRYSTYPAASHAAEMDGMILTMNLPGKWAGDTLLRLGYGEVSNTDADYHYRNNDIDPGKVDIVQLESDFSFGFSKGLMILSYVKFYGHEIFVSDLEEQEAELEEKTGTDYEYEGNETTGWYRTITLHAQLQNIANQGIDSYLTMVSTYSYSNGNRVLFSPVNSSSGAPDKCIGKFQSDDCDEPSKAKGYSGYAINVGGSYRISHEDRLSAKVGAEWHYGSQYYMGTVFYDDYSDYSLSYYNTRGSAYHLYWFQPLERGLSIRVGGYQMNVDYEGNFYQLPARKDRKFTDLYMNITAWF